MTRMERFEKIWAAQHAVPPESLLQYRWITQEGYRLPAMAAHFRTFCETLDSIEIDLSDLSNCFSPDDCGDWAMWLDDVKKLAEAAGLKVAERTEFVLQDEKFDSFTSQLADNPVSGNKTLQDFLARKSQLED